MAALPFPQLSLADAVALVVKHLDNRTRSRKSRHKRHSARFEASNVTLAY
jgi:hypothetical protein